MNEKAKEDIVGIDREKIKFKKFSDENLEVLTIFHEQIKFISNSRIIKDKKLGCSVTFNSEIGKETNIEAKFPDEDDLRSLLLLIRPMTMPNENIYINKIMNILISGSENDECRAFFKELKEQHENSQNISYLSIVIDEEKYSQTQVFSLWLDGYYFHKDQKKRDKLKSFSKIEYYAKEMLITTLINYLYFFRFIDNILSEQGVFPI